MSKIIFFFVSLFSFCSCKAQKDVPPPIDRIELITNKGIEYKFPIKINQILNNIIEKEKVNIIRLSSINDSTYNIRLYFLNNISSLKIIKKSNRYYLYKKKILPIIFDTDYIFSTPNFTVTDGGFWITFKYNDKNKEGVVIGLEYPSH